MSGQLFISILYIENIKDGDKNFICSSWNAYHFIKYMNEVNIGISAGCYLSIIKGFQTLD